MLESSWVEEGVIHSDGKGITKTRRSWETNFYLIDEVCSGLVSLGVPRVAASRIGEYRRAFHELRDRPDRDLPVESIPRLLRSLTDFHELRRIVAAARASAKKEQWISQLQAIPSGVPFPAEPDPRPDGRDIQFECFVGAVLELGGAEIDFAEPDLVVRHGGTAIAVAAKRPRSKRAALRNVRRGIRQVRDSRLKGIVAVDFSTALHHAEYVKTEMLQEGALRVREAADEAVSELAYRIGSEALDAGVVGLLAHVMLPMANPDSPAGMVVATSLRWSLAHLINKGEDQDPTLDGLDSIIRRGLEYRLPGDEGEPELIDEETSL